MSPATGLPVLAYALGVTLALMAGLFVLNRILVRFGLLPLCAALSLSGFNSVLFYLLIFPGTVVHELSHFLACLATFVPVQEVQLFSPQKNGLVGWVRHGQADPVRRNIIALAPFIGGSLAIYALVRYGLPASRIDPLAIVPNDVAQGMSAALASIMETLRSTDLHKWEAWLVLYTLFSVGQAIAPSSLDLRHVLVDGFVLLGIVLVLRLVDTHYGLGLTYNMSVVNTATRLAVLVQRLNALLLFACTAVGLGTILVVPVAQVAHWFRRGLS